MGELLWVSEQCAYERPRLLIRGERLTDIGEPGPGLLDLAVDQAREVNAGDRRMSSGRREPGEGALVSAAEDEARCHDLAVRDDVHNLVHHVRERRAESLYSRLERFPSG